MSTDQIARAAYQKLREGDAPGAEALLAPAIAADPSNASALQLMGIICQQQGKLEAATGHMRASIAAQPNNAQALNNLGVVLQARGETEEAVACFRQALAVDPRFIGARVGLIRSLMTLEPEAGADEAEALTRQDQSPQAWELRSSAERAAGRFAQAFASADESIRLAPQVGALRPNRALALEQLGRPDEALLEWEGLARSGMRSPEFVAHYARALMHAKRAGEAETILRQALQQWPADATLHSVLARLLWVGGKTGEFMAPIEAALRDQPNTPALRSEAAFLLSRAGQLDRAEAIVREGLALAPGDVGLVKALSSLLSEQNKLEEALAVLEANPSPRLRGDRAVLLMRLGRAEEALKELRSVPRRMNGRQELVALEALAMRQLGDPGYQRLYDYERFVKSYDVAPPFGTTAEFNAKLAQSLRRLHDTTQHPLDQTLRNGTQTGRDLRHVDDPIVKAFLAALDKPIRAYIASLSPDDALGARRREGYRMTGCWSVRLKPGGFHINHVHDEGWISSAYYVDLPPDTSRGDTQGGWIKFGEPPWPLAGAGPGKIVQPRVGMLVLFPSYMLHGTIPFAEGEERLTAAFDLAPV